MRYLISFCLAALLAGCAGMTEQECRVANWYQLGERDGLLGSPARIDTYAHQCSGVDMQTARQQYLDGWWMGNAEYRQRTAGTRSS